MISVSKRRSNLHAIPSLISSLHPMDINTHPHMVMAIPSLSSLLQCLDTCTTILLMRHYIRYVLILLFMRINRSDLSPWILEHKHLLKWWTCLWLVGHFFKILTIFCCLTCGLCVTCELSFMCSFTLEKSLAPRVLSCKHSKGHFVHHCCHCLNIFSFIYSLFHHMLFLLAMGLHLLQVRIVEWWLFRKVTKHSVLWKQILLSLNPISWLHVCRIAYRRLGA